jgi:hypothetical protein
MFYIIGIFAVVLVIAGFFGLRSAAERMGRRPLLCHNQARPSIKQSVFSR